MSDTHTQFPYITSNDVTSIETIVRSKSSFSGVDLLLTSDWPKGVENHTSVPEGLNMRHVGSEAVARLAMAVRPRYHFAGTMQCFYERTPYRYMYRLMYMYMGAESWCTINTHVSLFPDLKAGNVDHTVHVFSKPLRQYS